MDKIKQTTGKLKGGVLAAIIATLIALLTVGAGVAFGAEGIRDGVMNFITETVGGTIGGITQTFGGGNGNDVDIHIIWNDNNNALGVRPNSVAVSMNGVECEVTGSSTDGVWYGTFEDVENVDEWTQPTCPEFVNYERGSLWDIWPHVENGQTICDYCEITYTIRDKVRDENTSTSFEVNLYYDDDNNALGNRVDSVPVTITNTYDWTDVYSGEIAMGANGTGSQTVNLPAQFTNGDYIPYSVSVDFSPGYQPNPWGANVSNITSQGSVTIALEDDGRRNNPVTIHWLDDGTGRPSTVSVNAYEDGTLRHALSLNASDATVSGNTWTWDGVVNDVTVQNGDYVTFGTLTAETSVSGYDILYANYNTDGGVTFTLKAESYTPANTFDLPVAVEWYDEAHPEYRPSEVTVAAYLGDWSESSTSSVPVATTTVRAADGWRGSFEDLIAEDNDGHAIGYKLKETYLGANGGYYQQFSSPSKITASELDPISGWYQEVTIQNSITQLNIGVVKQWYDDDDAAGARPDSITVDIKLNGSTLGTVVLDKSDASIEDNPLTPEEDSNQWYWSSDCFASLNLPTYDEHQEFLPYTVEEVPVANYTLTRNEMGWEGKRKVFYLGNTYAPPVTGSLTVSKTVSGTGADTSQGFAFTVTFTGNIADDTYGDMTVSSGVATFSLSHGQSATATGLPAGITYAVSEASVANYEPSWTGQSGTVTAGGSATASCENVYTAPSYITPDTTDFSVTRTDEGAGAGSTMLMLTESIPAGTSAAGLNRSALKMTVQPPVTEIEPTVDTTNNALSYNFSLDNGQTMSVPLVRGSNVTITNNTSGVDLTDTNGSDTPTIGTSFSVGNSASPMSMTLMGAESANSGSQHESRPQGWIRVNSSAGNTVTYDAFKVFDAAVTYDDPDYKATHLEWEDNTVKSAVMGYLRNATNHNDYDAWLASKYNLPVGSITNEIEENPQNAAEWIALKIADSTEDTTANTTPKTTKGETFATQLALTLRQSNVQPTVVQPNTVTQVDQGYYLVGTTPSTIGDGEVGTAPIWAPVPQTGYTVDEKVGIPTFDKQVKDNTDVTDSYGKIADASTGQWLDFKMTSVMPSNLEAFPTYPLTITDVVPAGMDATISKDNGFSVYLGETDITDLVTTTLVGRTLTMSVSDMRSIDGVDVTGNDVLTVNYRAKLNENSVKGDAGNTNTATLTYRADPLTETTASLTSSATVLTYGIQLDKVDEATRLDVNGAQFAVKAIGLGANNSDLWVKSDGSLTSTEAERGIWTTTNGTITVSGLDEGTYDLVEVAAPNLYEVLATPVRVIIDAQKNYANGTLTSLGATVSGGNGNMVQNPTATQDGYLDSDMATGVVRLRASDVRQVVLPLTGMPVKTAAIIVGIAVAVISCVAYVMSKRNRDDSEGDDEE